MVQPARRRAILAATAAAAIVLAAPAAARAQDVTRTYTFAEVETKPALASVVNFQRVVAEAFTADLAGNDRGGPAAACG